MRVDASEWPAGGPQHSGPIRAPTVLAQLLARADVRINGGRPWDLQVHHPRMFQRVLRQGTLGFGEAYMDGDWDCEQLDELFTRLLQVRADRVAHGLAWLVLQLEDWRHRLLNLQSQRRAFQVGEQHYDVGNDLFEQMLDSGLIYSCAYWEHASTLEAAQEAKLELICRKLQLQPGEHLLEIGCGWGGLARYAAERYGVRVTGVTVSQAQLEVARQRCAGLPVTLLLQDYRDLTGQFDKVVSVGMFEHVGPKNYPVYFETARRLMRPDGLFLLHTIGSDVTVPSTDAWIDRYVFPNGKLPSACELTEALEGRWLIEDWHNFGSDYDRTLMAWHERFEAAWPQLQARYSERFRRMWRYYLLSCAGLFRSRQGQLWQLLLTQPQRREVYRSVRLGG